MNIRWIHAVVAIVACNVSIFVISAGCERHADIRDENDDVLIDNTPKLEAGPIPLIDSGLESDAYPACQDRPLGECVGSNDFLCGFDKWVKNVVQNCLSTTGCQPNGWINVKMAGNGCVSEIRMNEPHEPMVACLVAEFGAAHCPCGETEESFYFGESNSGQCPNEGGTGP